MKRIFIEAVLFFLLAGCVYRCEFRSGPNPHLGEEAGTPG